MAGPLDYVNPPSPMGMDPFFLAGLGMMGQAGQSGAAGIGQGAMQGMLAYSQMQGTEAQNELARRKLELANEEAQRKVALRQQLGELPGLPPHLANLVRVAPEQAVGPLVKAWGEGQGSALAGGLLTREELLDEFKLEDYSPESVKEMNRQARTLGGYDPGLLTPKPPTHTMGDVAGERERFAAKIKPLRVGVSKGRQVLNMLEREGPISDVATLYSLISTLDPESVVREGEVGLVNSAVGLYDRLLSNVQRAQGEGFLTENMKEDMRGVVRTLLRTYQEQEKIFRQDAESFAGQYGIKPRLVVGSPIGFPAGLGDLPATPTSGQTVQDVVNSGTATSVDY